MKPLRLCSKTIYKMYLTYSQGMRSPCAFVPNMINKMYLPCSQGMTPAAPLFQNIIY